MEVYYDGNILWENIFSKCHKIQTKQHFLGYSLSTIESGKSTATRRLLRGSKSQGTGN